MCSHKQYKKKSNDFKKWFVFWTIEVNNKSGNEVPWYVAGPSCDSVDVLSREQMLPATTIEGDLLYFPNAGAYTTVYANEFNGFPLPKVLIINE